MMKHELLYLSTFNCRGLGDHSKRRTVFHWLKRFHDGIIFLQETHSCSATEPLWRRDWKGQSFFSHGKSSARGVAILISVNLNVIVNEIICDSAGRFLLLVCSFEGEQIILANIYAPTKDKMPLQIEFLDFLRQKLIPFSDKNLIIGGDFNI